MRRAIYYLLPVALLALLLTGCGRRLSDTTQVSSSAPRPTATSGSSTAADNAVNTADATAEADSGGDAANGGETVIEGDPARGEELFTTYRDEVSFACATCHHVNTEDMLVGPGLLNVYTRAATRVEGLSAEEYIRQSILEPSVHVVETYPDFLMPQVYRELFSDEDINDIIAYLKTLEG